MAGSKVLFFLKETIMKIQIGGWRGLKGGLLLAVILTGPVLGQQTGDECTGMVPLVDLARGGGHPPPGSSAVSASFSAASNLARAAS